jgi:DNA-directed RNA polymerase subunit RPC12/RpoP
MKRLFYLILLLFFSLGLFAIGPKKVNFCGKEYKKIKIVRGITIKDCSKKFFTKSVTDINFNKINLDSLITKNKFTLVVFSSIYAIGCGSNIGVRAALLNSLVKKFPGKIVEIIEYWNNYEMNRTVNELQENKLKYTYTFEIIPNLPIYLDKDARNITDFIKETGPYFLHSGWAIVDNRHHLRYLFLEDTCGEDRKMKKTAKIVKKFLSKDK